MSYSDNMEGVTFGEMHSYRDWGLILEDYPQIEPADPKTNSVDVPCANGVLDLTESLTGEVVYSTRPLSFSFFKHEDYGAWEDLTASIRAYMHGKKMRIVFDNDPAYFYYGRITVSAWAADDKRFGHLTVSVDAADPFKYEIASSTEDWLWDPFSFLTGVVREYKDLVVDGELTITVTGSASTVVPTITCSAPMTVTYNGNVYILSEGDNVLYELSIPDGQHTLVFEGNGTVSIDYRGGVL